MNYLISALKSIVGEKPHGAPSLQPPSEWFDSMVSKIRKGNPSYSEERIRKTVGDIWYNELTDAKRKEIRERYGKKYGKAS